MTDHHLQVFDPPLCCSTGVCGPEPDPALARRRRRRGPRAGARVERSLAREPGSARTPAVADASRRSSIAALLLVLVDGQVLSEGAYPSRAEPANRLGRRRRRTARLPILLAPPVRARLGLLRLRPSA
jgi:hypothetical protein